ncbi:MAG: virulence factor SrfB [Defluviicoccus sp.]
MLAELVQFSEKVSLIMGSGIQFLDFGLTLDLRREAPGEFVAQSSGGSLARLQRDPATDRLCFPGNPGAAVRSTLDVPVESSFKLLNECWLPLPYLRVGSQQHQFASGPTTWARGRVVALKPGEDLSGATHRLTIAFDTTVFEGSADSAYLAPTKADVQSGATFKLAFRANEMGWFTEAPWIAAWLREVFEDQAKTQLRLQPEDIQAEEKQLTDHAHYLNWLTVIGERARLPVVVVRSNAKDDVEKAIPVDMVLDVGNSRTCGILIEDHPQQGHGLKNRYELALRDLTQPQHVCVEPFESRIEFAQVVLGKEQHACQSGRNDAFVWPTIARVGPEAARLANNRRGTEGSTGLSSPKRYLWNEERYVPGWRFNVSVSRAEIEPHATGAPFSNLVNELGDALYDVVDPNERMPVFMPHYSRSALMTFMLSEVLTQALVQINSPSQRLKQGDPEKARHLRTIILTVPPSMPKPERDIFAKRMEQAMALVWKALGWHGEDEGMDPDGQAKAWPPFPVLHMQWDEATCAQVVYVFSESQEHFGGRPEDFFRALRRKREADTQKRITVASIDIGGGTSDLVVTDYCLDEGSGANVYIRPEQRFRDGFKIAGDDLVLEVVQKLVVPAIEDKLRTDGVNDPGPLLSRLIGSEPIPVHDMALRQQLALQILYPMGLRILKDYEQYNPIRRTDVITLPLGEWLQGREPPSDAVISYFATGVRREAGAGGERFNLLDVPVTIDLNGLHWSFLTDQLELCKTIQALSEIVYLYNCDVLLLSGRPSRLPGVQALFRMLLPLPPDRIIPLHGYRTGIWYPFHKDGRIDDPKSTAAVGAMICKVGGERKIPNFNLLSNAFTAYSTVRNIGLMDQNMIIKDEDVYYRDVRLDEENYELPDTPFEMRGRMVLGFRQLDNARWGGSPLYLLDFTDKAKERLARSDRNEPPVVKVQLAKENKRGAEGFKVQDASCEQVAGLSPSSLELELNTLTTIGIGETSYWLDTGSVIR